LRDGDMLVAHLLCFLDWGCFLRLKTEQVGFLSFTAPRVHRKIKLRKAGLPEPEYRQSEFMLYATLKNKNWGKEDASWSREEQVREQDREQDEISVSGLLLFSSYKISHPCLQCAKL